MSAFDMPAIIPCRSHRTTGFTDRFDIFHAGGNFPGCQNVLNFFIGPPGTLKYKDFDNLIRAVSTPMNITVTTTLAVVLKYAFAVVSGLNDVRVLESKH